MKIFIVLVLFLSLSANAQDIKSDSVKRLAVNLPDSKPEFPGGVKAFHKHIAVRMRGYKPKQKGKAIIHFIVETDGSVSDAHMVTGLDKETNERLLSIITNSVNWKPAVENRKFVRAKFSLPVKLAN